MNLNTSGGPIDAEVTFNVDMNMHITNGEFNPGSDFVDVAGTFNDWAGSDHMTDEDGDGIYSITISGAAIGNSIEYKYRINGNWDTSEFPDGGPNRTYTVRYWNVLNDIYNNGLTTGISSQDLSTDFSVYPNPSNGRFTVAFNTTSSTDVYISIVNLKGQVCYSNRISNVGSGSETIDTDLPKGMYFLKVRNGSEIKLHKLVIQ